MFSDAFKRYHNYHIYVFKRYYHYHHYCNILIPIYIYFINYYCQALIF